MSDDLDEKTRQRMFTAMTIAEQVVRPVKLDDGHMGVGLYMDDHCQFVMPMQFVSGTDDVTKLLQDMRGIIRYACLWYGYSMEPENQSEGR
jgi:hypothetical protein